MMSRDRQARDLPLDAHLHTDLSPDSDVPIDAFAEQAVARGIRELAITDHVDFEPGAPAYRRTAFAERERVVRDAAERWADAGLAIHFGVEITWDRRFADDIADHLRQHPYDFVIGSVHVYRGSVYEASNVASWVAGRSLAEIVAPYFDEVEAGARSGLFDAIGHLDMVKRYLAPHVTAADLAAAPELYTRLLDALVESGTALEVNTSGLRQPAGELYPSAAIVARYRAMGGQAVTVGSDAHRAAQFAWGLDEGYEAAAAAGFDALTFRRGGGPVTIGLDRAPNVSAGHSL
ncbi:MAG TPA: histidinol-phosphatase HisJ family protein [Candidatus Saccharimonadales bacterium]|nr:histidinol-phosphatase HisJ family protein [Candidatus Saccharimonadales bacterium]